jgi:tRNA 2-selenouridine synthase
LDWLIIEVLLLGDRSSAAANNGQFENNLFSIVQNLNPNQPIWVEDERLIGQVAIPDAFYTKMRDLPVYFLDVPLEERTKHLVTTCKS